jgi:interleukin 13 receptor alpha-2
MGIWKLFTFNNLPHKIQEKSKYSPSISVNPPQDFEILDPGLLGYLYLQWKPPVVIEKFKGCTLEYELKYRNVDSDSWKVRKA